eukprot:CAMPEP_0167758090 /NCGR_PEP_ID=MMETSP0110_2-20121227/10279_1 /TAXON_ID=629695 /ORGANISM="Gymnochlora sp., Strain CCMP2014" /LENGTH=683 /DNA_ID=CAMNT_0007644335 /DNA_START=100 /DNA_END=2151 /DNA_ORIENTATION=-
MSVATKAEIDSFGGHVFKGKVADEYLMAAGLPSGTLESEWTKDPAAADKVAHAVLNWAVDNGATSFCHWFQPMASSGVRHGLSGQVQNAFFKFDSDGTAIWDLKGKDLLAGETDGSSYPNGGLRATHTAGGYLKIDPTSNIWLRGDTIFIPACFVSYYGYALDEKTPLLRSVDALNREGKRLMSLLGWDIPGLQTNIGLEQEIFLIPREAYLGRPDLQLTGRTVIGKDAPRGQEMCDHYMAPPSTTSPALQCMAEIQRQCFQLGIPLRTRHREVAPNQYEFAPLFGSVTTQIDQNVIVMQIIEEVAPEFGLAALLQEKPFNNVNGSGKHNNWSVATTDGVNLLNVKQVNEASGNDMMFPIVMSAIVSGVDKHGDLMRCAIASPGNDFRLGACEAPPAIVSTYLGDDMTDYLASFKDGSDAPYSPGLKELDLGVECLGTLTVPAEDRNRTSPFPYGGHRFEFRAVGSSQNVSLVNTVLNTLTAEAFGEFSDAIEGGAAPRDVAAKALNEHWKVIFNGDNYDEDNQQMLTDRGVWRIDSGVDAICTLSSEKNIDLFSKMKVFAPEECKARQTALVDHYVGTVEMEALCMIDMLNQHVIPSVKACEGGTLAELEKAVTTIEHSLAAVHAEEDEQKKGNLARTLRLETMVELRDVVDQAEGETPASEWTLPSYNDLLFLDQNHDPLA